MPKIASTIQKEEPLYTEPSKPRRKSFFKRYFPLILLVLVIALATTSVYFYKKSTKNPAAVASQQEIENLVGKVGTLVVLPSNETPTIATVSDPSALKDQAFFADAQKGDKVLIYANAKKAILYRPSVDKIITIAPLNIDATAKAPVAQ